MINIYLIWFQWFISLFFNNLILLNALIAIVGNSFNRVYENKELYGYKHKQALNIEFIRYYDMYRHARGLHSSFDLYCIVSQHKETKWVLIFIINLIDYYNYYYNYSLTDS